MGRARVRPRRAGTLTFRGAVISAAATAALAPGRARAGAADSWVADSGNWSIAGNWSIGVPTATADVFIVQNDLVDRTVTYDYSGPSISLNSLTVDNTGGGTNRLSQADNVLGATSEYIGVNGAGTFFQSGGSNATTSLYLGSGTSGTGAYTLANGSLTAGFVVASPGGSSPGAEYIGASGAGGFVQRGGAHTIYSSNAAALTIGYNGGAGTYTLSAGALSVLGSITNTTASPLGTLGIGREYVGSNGVGVFNQSGGSHAIGGSNGGELYVGYNNGNGTYVLSDGMLTTSGTQVLSNGTLATNNGTAREYIGFNGTGTLTQSGGTHSINSGVGTFAAASLYVGYNGGQGTYTLSGGSLNLTLGGRQGGIVDVGHNGIGTFNQLAGVQSGGSLLVGDSGGIGTYNLAGGVLDVGGNESVGSAGSGMFNQTGGTHKSGNAPSEFDVGNRGGSGTYNLGGGSLLVPSYLLVGGASASSPYPGGTGTLNQTDGVLTVGVWLSIGSGTGDTLGNGIFNLSGGTVSIGEALNIADWVGKSVGVFNMTNGAVTAGGLYVAKGTNSTGSMVQTGGSITIAKVANSASSEGVNIGAGATSKGTYQLLGGSLMSIAAPTAGANININNGGTFFVGTNATVSGFGSLNQRGGTFTMPGTLTIDPSGTATVTGYNFTAGTATIGSIIGPGGSVAVGGGTVVGSVASLGIGHFELGSLSVGSGGTVNIAPAASRGTHTANTLQITGTGLLDLANHSLLVDNAATPEAAVRQYLHNAYNADPTSGIGNWNGRGGITSADAIASHNGASPDFRISVGYVNGAYAGDPLINGPIPGQETLATNRILVRPALYGDFNLDGKVDDTDLAIFSGLGQYNQPNPKFGWLGGDLNQDGKVDDTDLLIFSGAGNYNGPSYGAVAAGAAPAHASATPSLTGHTESNGDIVLSASTSAGTAGDGVLDFVYDPTTGHLTLSYDGDPRVTAAQPFQVVRFKSAGGHFIPANFNQTDFGAGVTATTAALNGTASGSNSVPDGYDMGVVLPAGLTVADLTSDLSLQWNVFGGGLTLKNGDVVVPEPGGLLLAGAAVALPTLNRRHRRRRGAETCEPA